MSPDAAYYRAWRRENPEYMERERERSRSRSRSPEQRRAERERAKERAAKKQAEAESQAAATARWDAKNPEWRREWHRKDYQRHREERIAKASLRKQQDRAMARVRQAERCVAQVLRRDDRTVVYDPLYEDAVSVALISLIQAPQSWKAERKEERALQDVKDFVRGERRWRWYAQELPDER